MSIYSIGSVSTIQQVGATSQNRLVTVNRANEDNQPNATSGLADSLKGLSEDNLMAKFDPRNMSRREAGALQLEMGARGLLPKELSNGQLMMVQRPGETIFNTDLDAKFDYLDAIKDRYEYVQRNQTGDLNTEGTTAITIDTVTAWREFKMGWDKIASRMTVRDWMA